MKKHVQLTGFFVTAGFLFLSFAGSLAPQTSGSMRVGSISGDEFVINAGSRHGIKENFTGETFTEEEVGGRKLPITTSTFVIVAVDAESSRARKKTESPTTPIQTGHLVKFDQRLIPQGILNVSSTPNRAEVYIGNDNMGLTDCKLYLDPGSYDLRIRKSGYEEAVRRSVRVSSGAEESVSIPLTREQPTTFRLKVDSTPQEAAVYIDDVFIGSTPLETELVQNQFELRVAKENYEVFSQRILLSKPFTQLPVTLEPNQYLVKITSKPSSARIYIDGEYVGISNWERMLDKGTRVVRLEKEGFETQEFQIQVSEELELNRALSPLGYGSVVVSAYPYAEIEIDGKPYGEVPPMTNPIRLTAGKHQIKFTARRLNIEKEIEIDLARDERKRIHEKLIDR